MKVRLELDVHPSEAPRVASLVSALRDFVAVLSSYSPIPEEEHNPNHPSPNPLTPSPTSALSDESSDPDQDNLPPAAVANSQPSHRSPLQPTPRATISARSPSTSNRALPRALPSSPPTVTNTSAKEAAVLDQPPAPSPHLLHAASVPDPASSNIGASVVEKPNPSISVELDGLISANLVPVDPIPSPSVADPSLASEDVQPAPKHTQSRPRQTTRQPKPRNSNRSNSRKTNPSDPNCTTSNGNRKPRSGSPAPEVTTGRTDESTSLAAIRRGRRNTRPTNAKNGQAASSTMSNRGNGSGNETSSSKQNGRRRPHIIAITTPQGLFEAVAVAGISVKRAISDLQGMLSRKTNPLSEDDLVDAATAEIVDPAKVCNHPSRGLNIVRVFIGLGEKYLAAFRRKFVTQAINQFVKDRNSGSDRAQFLGYSDGLSALVQENCISADAALKMIWRLLLSEGCWTAAVTTLCKLVESCNGALAQKCLDQELLVKVKEKLTELAKKNEFVYDITYLNGAMNWTIPVPQ